MRGDLSHVECDQKQKQKPPHDTQPRHAHGHKVKTTNRNRKTCWQQFFCSPAPNPRSTKVSTDLPRFGRRGAAAWLVFIQSLYRMSRLATRKALEPPVQKCMASEFQLRFSIRSALSEIWTRSKRLALKIPYKSSTQHILIDGNGIFMPCILFQVKILCFWKVLCCKYAFEQHFESAVKRSV